jgi:hypothetical protein
VALALAFHLHWTSLWLSLGIAFALAIGIVMLVYWAKSISKALLYSWLLPQSWNLQKQVLFFSIVSLFLSFYLCFFICFVPSTGISFHLPNVLLAVWK